jgi:hypothetical protein
VLSGLNSTNMVWELGMVDYYDLEPLEALLHVTVNNLVKQEQKSVL